jgi:hypothetical protein
VLVGHLLDDRLAQQLEELEPVVGPCLEGTPVDRELVERVDGPHPRRPSTRVAHQHDLVDLRDRRDVLDAELHLPEVGEQPRRERRERVVDEPGEPSTARGAGPVDGTAPTVGVGATEAGVAIGHPGEGSPRGADAEGRVRTPGAERNDNIGLGAVAGTQDVGGPSPGVGGAWRTTPLWFTARVIEPGEDRRGVGHDAGDAVVRPLTRAAQRPCARPGCPAPAGASLLFSYASREVWLDRLGEPSPQAYDLCAGHAARTQAPRGWELRDRRPADERGAPDGGARSSTLGGEETVALLAAALRAVPDLPSDAPDAPSVAAPTADGPTVEPVDGLAADALPADALPADEPSSEEHGTVPEDEPSPVVGQRAAPKPILAARSRTAPPPVPGDRAAEW